MEATALDTAPPQEALPRPQTGQAASSIFDLLLRESAGDAAEVPERPTAETRQYRSDNQSEAGAPSATDEGQRAPATGSTASPSPEAAAEAADAATPTPQPALPAGVASMPGDGPALFQHAPANALAPVPVASDTTSALAAATGIATQRAADPRTLGPAPSLRTPATPPAPAQALPESSTGARNSVPAATTPGALPAAVSAAAPAPSAIAPVAAATGSTVAPDPRPVRSTDAPGATAPTGNPAGKAVAKGQVHGNADAGQPGTQYQAGAAKVSPKGPAAGASSVGATGLPSADAPEAGPLEARPLVTGPQVAVRGDLAPGQSLNGTADLGMRQAAAGAAPSAVAEQVAVHIRKAAAAGNDRISIRLHPAELGRIQVKIDLVDDGRVRAAIQADRPETLDLMQRDLRSLERALQDAGLKTDANSLSFSLRDHHGHGGPAGEDPGRQKSENAEGTELGDDDVAGYARWSPGDGRLDIRV